MADETSGKAVRVQHWIYSTTDRGRPSSLWSYSTESVRRIHIVFAAVKDCKVLGRVHGQSPGGLERLRGASAQRQRPTLTTPVAMFSLAAGGRRRANSTCASSSHVLLKRLPELRPSVTVHGTLLLPRKRPKRILMSTMPDPTESSIA